MVTLILVALLGLVLWLLATNLLSDDNNQTGGLITVPNVAGDSRQVAEQKITDAGLTVGNINRVQPTDDTQQPGTVLEQDPAANEEVEKDTAVNLTIVPSCTGVPASSTT